MGEYVESNSQSQSVSDVGTACGQFTLHGKRCFVELLQSIGGWRDLKMTMIEYDDNGLHSKLPCPRL